MPSSHARSPSGTVLTEEYIQDCFHSYLKSSLTQAKVERLLDADILKPPAVPLPRVNKGSTPMDLSAENCPAPFRSFLQVWARAVPVIQSFTPEHQHDLARIICGLPPLNSPPDSVHGVAADLRAVAIEISQRRSFQNRYAADLQAALDSGNPPSSPGAKKASFVPPPSYDASSTSSPSSSAHSSPHSSAAPLPPPRPTSKHDLPPQSPSHLSPYNAPSAASGWPARSPSPTILSPSSPAIEFIRETLYAALGDVLERLPSLRAMLKQDAPRAYFSSVAFAILDVATSSITPDGSVVGVLGTTLSLDDCPPELRPFMLELAAIAREAMELEEEDNRMALEYAQRGDGTGEIPPTKMDRVRAMLENGVGCEQRRREEDAGRGSPTGRAVSFSNRINGLSLALTTLRAFRERQDIVFQILAGIGS
ncbi:hypothetical protein V5O48_007782 [Marasmius crinis-equi]|uniref:Uncharacterized protein n=1 Tax=Marasmius crinis-equi TaxID=585013 RepID=A0ABR3FFP4_9AGAR